MRLRNYCRLCKIGFSLLILFLFLVSCKNRNKPFDKDSWINFDGTDFSQREPIVKDLMDHYLYKGMKYPEIIRLLGKPEIYDEKKRKANWLYFISGLWVGY
ncbi:hypothetical protein [Parabacteroides sp. FAFU027]|uniref:hypothetical protein n=1 Tax=Parabacteroides sp. FAFU027 TaxID=2922715 RepID=UPI001FB02055|nr:hypothetical protein [Parabacteroides sp. FAFU027]